VKNFNRIAQTMVLFGVTETWPIGLVMELIVCAVFYKKFYLYATKCPTLSSFIAILAQEENQRGRSMNAWIFSRSDVKHVLSVLVSVKDVLRF